MTSGVYAIAGPDGVYVGSSRHVETRVAWSPALPTCWRRVGASISHIPHPGRRTFRNILWPRQTQAISGLGAASQGPDITE